MTSLSSGRRDEFTQHRYYTRSSRDVSTTHHTHSPEARYPPTNEAKQQYFRNSNTYNVRPAPLRRHVPPPPPPPLPPSESTANENDESQEMDTTQSDCLMDQITYSTSNPIRAPFPSPAMKTSQPFYPFPSAQQGTPLHEGWGPHHQGGVNGQCILVEAANRAQMAILVDDMGNMGFEPMEQT